MFKQLTALILLSSYGIVLHSQEPGVDCAHIEGQGWSGCAPLNPSQQPAVGQQPQVSQPPLPRWADHWGAIAIFEPSGSLGVAIDMPSQNIAEQTALIDCRSKHGSICKIEISYRNQCAALIVSRKGYNTNAAPTEAAAIQKGMQICNDSGDADCHPAYTGCSLPRRIQ
jgi:hypothetical protein